MTANQLQYQRNLITSAELEESKRHNLVSEQNDYNRAVASLMQAGASQQQAEAALQQAAASAKRADTERMSFWTNLANTIGHEFGLTPMSSSEIGANAGKAASGFGGLLA